MYTAVITIFWLTLPPLTLFYEDPFPTYETCIAFAESEGPGMAAAVGASDFKLKCIPAGLDA